MTLSFGYTSSITGPQPRVMIQADDVDRGIRIVVILIDDKWYRGMIFPWTFLPMGKGS